MKKLCELDLCARLALSPSSPVFANADEFMLGGNFVADILIESRLKLITAKGAFHMQVSKRFPSLYRIEEELGAGAKYAGEKFRSPLK